ncbi:hypothetical protein HanPSC8_Chr09g0366361 [Helianthus annuus]|nr:hypothetical protein HanPSC8_Chr09g0366361 [Helianthus annuus]
MDDDILVDDPVVPIIEVPAVDVVVLPPIEAPVEEALFDPSGPDSFESVASATLHDQGVQHYSTDTDSDMAMSAAPIVPQDFGPDPEVEFVPAEPAPVGPEPVIAHDPIDVPPVALFPDPLPAPDHVDLPVVAPPVVDAPVIAPPVLTMHPLPPTSILDILTPVIGGLMMMMTILRLCYQSLHLLHLFFRLLIFPSFTRTHLMPTARIYPLHFSRTFLLPVQGKDLLLGRTIACHP